MAGRQQIDGSTLISLTLLVLIVLGNVVHARDGHQPLGHAAVDKRRRLLGLPHGLAYCRPCRCTPLLLLLLLLRAGGAAALRSCPRRGAAARAASAGVDKRFPGLAGRERALQQRHGAQVGAGRVAHKGDLRVGAGGWWVGAEWVGMAAKGPSGGRLAWSDAAWLAAQVS